MAVPQERHEFPELDGKVLGRQKPSVEVWQGMIRVYPDPQEKPLTDWLQGVDKYIDPRVEELIEYPYTGSEHEINAGWKIVVENYIDSYHLSHLH